MRGVASEEIPAAKVAGGIDTHVHYSNRRAKRGESSRKARKIFVLEEGIVEGCGIAYFCSLRAAKYRFDQFSDRTPLQCFSMFAHGPGDRATGEEESWGLLVRLMRPNYGGRERTDLKSPQNC